MIYRFIQKAARSWEIETDSPASTVLSYIKDKGKLRDAQIGAIETYLFLKMGLGCKSLSDIFTTDCNRFFQSDLTNERISQYFRERLNQDDGLRSLFELSKLKESDEKEVLPRLRSVLENDPDSISSTEFFQNFFYGVDYPDYLFSLPMGSGKTYLMAAFIYLDLYFSELEPDNPVFAKNFLILIPSGLKSSIVPSLRTIEEFDPSWVIPEPAASRLKRMLRFEVLDQPKSAKSSNRTQNPNVAKVLEFQPFQDQRGAVFIVNAEKVILDKVSDQLALNPDQSQEESERQANELRSYLGRLPGLQILIDEVHHATDSEIKLRKVVHYWQSKGNIVSVLGFSGTPYLSRQEEIFSTDTLKIKSKEITNTVFYYPLITGISRFLKKPEIKISSEKDSLRIVKRGVADFMEKFGGTVYSDGTCAKLAIYCGKIERLEEEIYPYIVQKLQIPPEQVLKYHKGNKTYKVSPEQEMKFRTLDHPSSKIKIILLVQVGKEGWDCRSLTGVILSNKGDSPTNMVLQTSCRCLREVTNASEEKALVWLNPDNAKILDKQLSEEQKTSIEELNSYQPGRERDSIERISRMQHLYMPELDFLQLRIKYDIVEESSESDINQSLSDIMKDSSLKRADTITTRGLDPETDSRTDIATSDFENSASFDRWIETIYRNGTGYVQLQDIHNHNDQLKSIYNQITTKKEEQVFFDTTYNLSEIEKRIRMAFRPKRTLKISEETVSEKANLLYVNRLKRIENHTKIYPDREDSELILELDNEGSDISSVLQEKDELRSKLKSEGKSAAQINRLVPPDPDYSTSVIMKDSSFHYLPYDFRKSNFEKELLQSILTLSEFRNRKLEIYFNGEPNLTGFRIDCYSKPNGRWKREGLYTPDFLIIQRKRKSIHKCLILEAKGSGFEDQVKFKARRNFVEDVFLRMNNEKAGYDRFQYLFLSDTDKKTDIIVQLQEVMAAFFESGNV